MTAKIAKRQTERDFVIVCPVMPSDASVADALAALYYLPPYYRLVLLEEVLQSPELSSFLSDDAISDRLSFETEQGLHSAASPCFYADVLVQNAGDRLYANFPLPRITVNGTVDGDVVSQPHKDFAVSSHRPEALASALLQLNRSLLFQT